MPIPDLNRAPWWLPSKAALGSNFWKLWVSSVTANLADGVTLVAIPLIAVRLTSSPAEIAGVAVASQVPMR